MDLQVVQAEHAHVAGEPVDPDRGAGLGGDQVEQVVRVVEGALALDRHGRPELVGDLEEGPLEVGRELAGVPTGRAARHAIALHEQHAVVGRAKREERGRDTGDPGTHDRDVRRGVRIERPGRPVGAQLGDPGRAVGPIGIWRDRNAAFDRRVDLPHGCLRRKVPGRRSCTSGRSDPITAAARTLP